MRRGLATAAAAQAKHEREDSIKKTNRNGLEMSSPCDVHHAMVHALVQVELDPVEHAAGGSPAQQPGASRGTNKNISSYEELE